MKRAVAFVDGFNLYYALEKSNVLKQYKWLSLYRLLSRYLQNREEKLTDIFYFTAVPRNAGKRERHQTYIKALRSEGVHVVRGYLRSDPIECLHCKKEFMRSIEKQTDANIMAHLMSMAFCDDFDTALIVSADSDLVPMIKAVKTLKPDKKFRVVIPTYQKANELTQVCGDRRKIKQQHLADSQFPHKITLENGAELSKPGEW